jgi:hypothetical protein
MIDKYEQLECGDILANKCENIKSKILDVDPHIKEVNYGYFLRNEVDNVLRFQIKADSNIFERIIRYGETSEKNIKNNNFNPETEHTIETIFTNFLDELGNSSIEVFYLHNNR